MVNGVGHYSLSLCSLRHSNMQCDRVFGRLRFCVCVCTSWKHNNIFVWLHNCHLVPLDLLCSISVSALFRQNTRWRRENGSGYVFSLYQFETTMPMPGCWTQIIQTHPPYKLFTKKMYLNSLCNFTWNTLTGFFFLCCLFASIASLDVSFVHGIRVFDFLVCHCIETCCRGI